MTDRFAVARVVAHVARVIASVIACVAACLVSAGCSSTPEPITPANDPRSVAVPDTPPESPFESRQRQRAAGLARQGRWADAATAWEVLCLLRPDVPEYGQRLAEARALGIAAAADHETRAAQAFRRGDLDLAMRHDLAALAIAPDSAAASANLKAIERERVRRNTLGRYSRLTLSGRGAGAGEGEGEMVPQARPPARPASAASTASAATPPASAASAAAPPKRPSPVKPAASR